MLLQRCTAMIAVIAAAMSNWRQLRMRKLIHGAALVFGIAPLAACMLTPAIANASTNGSTARRATTITQYVPQQSRQPACQTVQSPGRKARLRCSALLADVRSQSAPPLSAKPRYNFTKNASVRVTCGGYNGHVYYNDDLAGVEVVLQTWGELWDTCGARTYLYLSWEELGGALHYDPLVSTASDHATVGVNHSYVLAQGASDIGIAVCSNYSGGWHCGGTQHF